MVTAGFTGVQDVKKHSFIEVLSAIAMTAVVPTSVLNAQSGIERDIQTGAGGNKITWVHGQTIQLPVRIDIDPGIFTPEQIESYRKSYLEAGPACKDQGLQMIQQTPQTLARCMRIRMRILKEPHVHLVALDEKGRPLKRQ